MNKHYVVYFTMRFLGYMLMVIAIEPSSMWRALMFAFGISMFVDVSIRYDKRGEYE